MLLYLDTNVLLDYLLGRKNVYGKDIGEPIFQLFTDTVNCKHYVIISTWMLEEASKQVVLESAELLFNFLGKKLVKVEYSEHDLELAKKQNPDHFQDELHGILALNAGADCIVTRDIGGFRQFTGKIEVKKPEWLLQSNSF